MQSDVYAVFGNSIRVQLLLCLSEGPKHVTQLIGNCGLAQSAVSQHLAKLKHAGLVTTNRQGKRITYSLKYRQAADIASLLQTLAEEII